VLILAQWPGLVLTLHTNSIVIDANVRLQWFVCKTHKHDSKNVDVTERGAIKRNDYKRWVSNESSRGDKQWVSNESLRGDRVG
jgi:hypothetical protein